MFYDFVKLKLKKHPSIFVKEMLIHPSSAVLAMDGDASLLSLVLVLRRFSGSSQSRAILENFCFILFHLLVPEIVIKYSEIPFRLLEDRVKVGGLNLLLL